MDYQNNMEQEERRNPNRGLLLILGLILALSVGFNIWQFVRGQNNAAKIEHIGNELVDSEALKKELQEEVSKISAQLQEYRGQNAQLDSAIAEKDRELLDRRLQIEKLLKENKISYNRYLQAKDEIGKFKYFADKYKAQVEGLMAENNKLKGENQNLSEAVNKNKRTIDDLKDANAMLGNKVALAEVLKTDQIEATAIRLRGGNKERETTRASQAEKIRVCFSLKANDFAKAGDRQVYLKLTDPTGQPIFVEGNGGGTFEYQGGMQTYTSKGEFNYDNTAGKNYCISYQHTVPWQPGDYKAELYTDGYKLGEKSFKLN